MTRLSLWNSGRKGKTFEYMDKMIGAYVQASGTAVYLHKYIGPYDTRTPNEDGTPLTPIALNESSIQDVLFLENRDRKYDSSVYELRGTYNVQDQDIDLRQFGAFLSGDTIFIEFHMNDMIRLVGRRIMSGDVLELVHLRDDATLDPNSPAINKFYVVEDASRGTDGYGPTWFPHMWRVKCGPMTDSQQYSDILNQQAENPFGVDQGTLKDILSTIGTEMNINDEVVEAAKLSVSKRNFETRQFYVIPGDETAGQNPWIYAGDGIPPDGAALVGSGNSWPIPATEGDYYLRTDMSPHALFLFQANAWRLQELDYRMTDWTAMHRLLKSFIDNDTTTAMPDGRTFDEKQPLYKAVKPRADF